MKTFQHKKCFFLLYEKIYKFQDKSLKLARNRTDDYRISGLPFQQKHLPLLPYKLL